LSVLLDLIAKVGVVDYRLGQEIDGAIEQRFERQGNVQTAT
jgi:hypothetical protein